MELLRFMRLKLLFLGLLSRTLLSVTPFYAPSEPPGEKAAIKQISLPTGCDFYVCPSVRVLFVLIVPFLFNFSLLLFHYSALRKPGSLEHVNLDKGTE